MKKSNSVLAGAVVGTMLLAANRAPGIVVGVVTVDDSGNATINNGIFLNDFIGATRFYDEGFGGSLATVANIEGGFVWNGHDAFVNRAVNQYLIDPSNPLASSTPPPYVDHATGVGSVLAGLGPLFITSDGIGFSVLNYGIAPFSQLWSGAIATTLNSDDSFDIATNSAFIIPYQTAMITGVNGKTADVINSSWGESSDMPIPGVTAGPGSNGNDYFVVAIDAMVAQSGKTMVFSAGNGGPAAQVNSPAAGFNSIVVGALGSVTDPVPYNSPSSFSSAAPNDMFIPFRADGSAGLTIPGVRAVVSLAAPGENFIVAAYTGDPTQTGFYSINAAGTSYAAPTVAGGATLVVDAGRTLFPTDPQAIDGRVVKAVLMNSADKTQGWNNGQQMVGGVIETTQSLDYATGAGRMNLNRAFDQYTAGTTDVPGLGGGVVAPIGWDFGQVGQGSPNDYLIDLPLLGGSTFAATLDWFAIDELGDASTDYAASYGKFDNLDLQIWSAIDGLPGSLIAESDSLFNSTEHLYFDVPQDGEYLIQVVWTGPVYDFVDAPGTVSPDDFGLAWSATQVPEPTSGALIVLAAAACGLRRRRRSASAKESMGIGIGRDEQHED